MSRITENSLSVDFIADSDQLNFYENFILFLTMCSSPFKTYKSSF